jgi:hypothetical protein
MATSPSSPSIPATKPVAKPVAKAAAKPRKAAAKRGVAALTLPEDHTESEAVAYGIRVEFNDLTPSVNRIMNAGLHEAGALRAITLFRDSLGVPGDANRDPAVAIEAGRKVRDS